MMMFENKMPQNDGVISRKGIMEGKLGTIRNVKPNFSDFFTKRESA